MDRTLIVLANAARARLCELDPRDASIAELADFVHTPSRQKGSDLTTDRPGRAAKGQASTGFEPHTDVHRKEHTQFARELSQAVDDALQQRRPPALMLVASNPFLGELKAQLSAAAARALVAAAPLDLTHCDRAELMRRIPELLQLQGVD